MIEIAKLEQELIEKVYEKLTGNIEIELNQIHFEELQRETGISIRKLKELFGIYKKRSEKSYEYTMSKLAQFIGFTNWNAFIRQEVLKGNLCMGQKKVEPIQVKKKIKVDADKMNKIIISVVVRGR